MSNKYIIIVSLLLGFFITYKINYAKKSQYYFQESIIVVDKTCYHIHHYMWLSLIVLCILIGRYVKNDKIILIPITNYRLYTIFYYYIYNNE